MDVRELLHTARAEACFDQRQLALAAGTARTTVVAYETGARSPTVRQLTRLLAACGLRARVVLEPISAPVDEVLARARESGPPHALSSVDTLSTALAEGRVQWALDGASAVAAQDPRLQVPHHDAEIVVVDDEATRAWLRAAWAQGWDRHGFRMAPNWYEDGTAVRMYTRRPVYTRHGFLRLRWVEVLPPRVRDVEVGGVGVPVLHLDDVRAARPDMDELLTRAAEQEPAG